MFDSLLEQFAEFLKSKGSRLTRERAIVARLAFAAIRNELSSEELRADIEASARVSRATIHRTLRLLKDSGLVTSNESRLITPETLERRLKHQKTRNPFWRLCERTHQGQIAGRCPWCGRDLFQDG